MVEELINKALRLSATLGGIAEFGNMPAIFYGGVPEDTDTGWGEARYPRCVYMINWQTEPERLRAGVLTVDIICIDTSRIENIALTTGNTPPEDLAAALAGELSGLFMTADDGTFALAWSNTEIYKSDEAPQIVGASISFDVLGFPVPGYAPAPGTLAPDIVASTMDYLKALLPDAHIIGKDALPELWAPSQDRPALYVRLSGQAVQVRAAYRSVWMRGEVAIHVLAPAPAGYVNGITTRLALDERIICDDGSPMFIKAVNSGMGASGLRNGQITFSGEYGVLGVPEGAVKLGKAVISEK